MRAALYPATSQARKLRRAGLPIPDHIQEAMRLESKARRGAKPTRCGHLRATLADIVDAINTTQTMGEAAERLGLRRGSVTTLHRILREKRLRVVRSQRVEMS